MKLFFKYKYGGKCRLCGRENVTISSHLGVCVSCLRERSDEALKIALESHYKFREKLGLPRKPPQTRNGLKCKFCGNECSLGTGERGFCGIIVNRNGRLAPRTND